MSMVINLVEDHNIYLCEGGPVYNGGVQPTPITYLTQWKIVGNSQVHTDPFLTSWKVSGNSVVDNNTILSCGDLGQDGKYHVKISNGVTIYDIPLTEPLRKVGSIADDITFTNGTATVTRELGIIADLSQLTWTAQSTRGSGKRWLSNAQSQFAACANDTYADILCAKYQTRQANGIYEGQKGVAININKVIQIYDSNYTLSEDKTAFVASLDGVELIAKLATPTTELIDVSPFPVSATDTYISANVVPYSAFEHSENKEIWSCSEYNATDGKYHILVQPQGGSIVDIALYEPLRKVNDVADTFIYPHPSNALYAMLSISLISFSTDKLIADRIVTDRTTGLIVGCRTTFIYSGRGKGYTRTEQPNILCNKIKDVLSMQDAPNHNGEFIIVSGRNIYVKNTAIEQTVEAYQSYFDSLGAIEIICPLNTPYKQTVNAPQIEEADSYSCVITPGGKAVSWSSFETE